MLTPINFFPIDEQQRQFFLTQGYLVVRNALSAATVSELIEASDRVMHSSSLLNRDMEDGSDGFRGCVELDDAFLQLVAPQATFPIIAQLMGPNIQLSSSHVIQLRSRESEAQWRPRWHSDIYGVEQDLGIGNMPRLGIKVGYCLTDHSKPKSGMTLIAPGSHLLRSPLFIPEGSLNPPGCVELSLNPGDAFFFENRTRHSVGLNTSGMTRKCVIIGYSFRWVSPLDSFVNPGKLARKLAPLARSLLPGIQLDLDSETWFDSVRQGESLAKWLSAHGFRYDATHQ